MKTHVHMYMYIAHYITKVVTEETKKGRKPRPNKLHHKQTYYKTLRCPALRTRTVGCV